MWGKRAAGPKPKFSRSKAVVLRCQGFHDHSLQPHFLLLFPPSSLFVLATSPFSNWITVLLSPTWYFLRYVHCSLHLSCLSDCLLLFFFFFLHLHKIFSCLLLPVPAGPRGMSHSKRINVKELAHKEHVHSSQRDGQKRTSLAAPPPSPHSLTCDTVELIKTAVSPLARSSSALQVFWNDPSLLFCQVVL